MNADIYPIRIQQTIGVFSDLNSEFGLNVRSFPVLTLRIYVRTEETCITEQRGKQSLSVKHQH